MITKILLAISMSLNVYNYFYKKNIQTSLTKNEEIELDDLEYYCLASSISKHSNKNNNHHI